MARLDLEATLTSNSDYFNKRMSDSQASTHLPNPNSLLALFKDDCARQLETDSWWITLPLTLYCVTAGLIGAIGFSACWVFLPFQTANTVQLGIAIARMFSPGLDSNPRAFQVGDKQAFTSLGCFLLGGLACQLIPARFDRKTKGFVASTSFIQVLLSAAATITSYHSHEPAFAVSRTEPSWTSSCGFVTIGLLSASFGLQGVVADRLGTPFGVSVVLTSLWVQLSHQPMTLWRKHVPRDQKALAIFSMFAGAVFGRALIGQLDDYASLAVATGLRFAVAMMWLLMPAKQRETLPSFPVSEDRLAKVESGISTPCTLHG